MKLRMRRRLHAADDDLPTTATPPIFYSGKLHGNVRLCECWWQPADGVAAGAFLDSWVSPQERTELAATGFAVVLTLVDLGGSWVPLTIVTRSAMLPDEYGAFAARDVEGGEVIGAVLDGRKLGHGKRESIGYARGLARVPTGQREYVYALQPTKDGPLHLYDGRACRFGGPMRANDARGIRAGNNCTLHASGLFCVGRFQSVPRLRAGDSLESKRRAELSWSYGREYWDHPPHAKKLRTVARRAEAMATNYQVRG